MRKLERQAELSWTGFLSSFRASLLLEGWAGGATLKFCHITSVPFDEERGWLGLLQDGQRKCEGEGTVAGVER